MLERESPKACSDLTPKLTKLFVNPPPQEILDSLESENVEELADVLADARLTIQYLAERHRRCQELPRDDPPTRLQEIAISSCENAWRLNVAIELARLTAAVSPHVDNGRDLAAQFSECSGIELPTPPPPVEEE